MNDRRLMEKEPVHLHAVCTIPMMHALHVLAQQRCVHRESLLRVHSEFVPAAAA